MLSLVLLSVTEQSLLFFVSNYFRNALVYPLITNHPPKISGVLGRSSKKRLSVLCFFPPLVGARDGLVWGNSLQLDDVGSRSITTVDGSGIRRSPPGM